MSFDNKKYQKEYRIKHREKFREYSRVFRLRHKKEFLIKYKLSSEEKIIRRKEYNKRYRIKNKDKLRDLSQKLIKDGYFRDWVKNNPEKRRRYEKTQRENHAQKHANKKHKWYLKNKDRLALKQKIKRPQSSARQKERYHTDIQFKLRKLLRNRLFLALRNFNQDKKGSYIKNIGCSMEDLKRYIESLFTEGMSWKNWGFTGWHIDHIIPLSFFDLEDINQLKVACHYTNLQPLWDMDNLRKQAKIVNYQTNLTPT